MLIQDQFEIEDGILKAYTGAGPDVIIPEGVHTIGEGVFKGMAWILKVKTSGVIKEDRRRCIQRMQTAERNQLSGRSGTD